MLVRSCVAISLDVKFVWNNLIDRYVAASEMRTQDMFDLGPMLFFSGPDAEKYATVPGAFICTSFYISALSRRSFQA